MDYLRKNPAILVSSVNMLLRDEEFEKDSSIVTKTSCFNLPIRRNWQGEWKVPSGSLIWTCFTSDFFIEEADQWREDAWVLSIRE